MVLLLTCSLLLWDHVASTGEAAASITEQLFEIKNKSSFREVGKKKKNGYDRQKRSPSAEQGSFDPTTTLLINFKIRAKPPTRSQNDFKLAGGKNEAHPTGEWGLRFCQNQAKSHGAVGELQERGGEDSLSVHRFTSSGLVFIRFLKRQAETDTTSKVKF